MRNFKCYHPDQQIVEIIQINTTYKVALLNKNGTNDIYYRLN